MKIPGLLSIATGAALTVVMAVTRPPEYEDEWPDLGRVPPDMRGCGFDLASTYLRRRLSTAQGKLTHYHLPGMT
jgi:hypothetical protein